MTNQTQKRSLNTREIIVETTQKKKRKKTLGNKYCERK